ncbi:MAG TPA: GNAT family N-acetyltransferase [Gaiellaceae bacterium]|nr:GNAT family N-acetyltransferase [Gaiellaceae bacterium]
MQAERIRDFRLGLQERVATRNLATPHGVVRLADTIPDVYDANFLSVHGAAAAADVLAAETDEAMSERFHRRVVVERGGPGIAEWFAELGWVRSTHLVLAHEREPDRRVDTSAVREASLDELIPHRTHAILREPWGDPEIAGQLNEMKRVVARAVPTRFFAVYAGDDLAGYCELRTRDGVAQIEDVEVMTEHRGYGLGRALVQHALEQGLRAADVVFLEALADDWPRELYAKLGFVAVDLADYYTQLPHALTRLRLRTSRLEVRLGTDAELAELGGADAQRAALDSWNADDWTLPLVGFRNGKAIGVRTLHADRFGKTRTVSTTGDGEPDLRAAALALAYEGLGATRVLTDGGEARPSSIPVEISGLHRLLPLFGAG